MSCLQPANDRMQNAESSKQNAGARLAAVCRLPTAFCRLDLNIRNLCWSQALHKLHHFIVVEARVVRFDHEKEVIARGECKIGGVKNRMVRLRQLVESQHSKNGRKR